jgi:ribosomal protein L37E
MSNTPEFNCKKCGHALKKNRHDKCLFCGFPMPVELHSSAEEKTAALNKFKQRTAEELTKHKEKPKQPDVGSDLFHFGAD